MTFQSQLEISLAAKQVQLDASIAQVESAGKVQQQLEAALEEVEAADACESEQLESILPAPERNMVFSGMIEVSRWCWCCAATTVVLVMVMVVAMRVVLVVLMLLSATSLIALTSAFRVTSLDYLSRRVY